MIIMYSYRYKFCGQIAVLACVSLHHLQPTPGPACTPNTSLQRGCMHASARRGQAGKMQWQHRLLYRSCHCLSIEGHSDRDCGLNTQNTSSGYAEPPPLLPLPLLPHRIIMQTWLCIAGGARPGSLYVSTHAWVRGRAMLLLHCTARALSVSSHCRPKRFCEFSPWRRSLNARLTGTAMCLLLLLQFNACFSQLLDTTNLFTALYYQKRKKPKVKTS